MDYLLSTVRGKGWSSARSFSRALAVLTWALVIAVPPLPDLCSQAAPSAAIAPACGALVRGLKDKQGASLPQVNSARSGAAWADATHRA